MYLSKYIASYVRSYIRMYIAVTPCIDIAFHQCIFIYFMITEQTAQLVCSGKGIKIIKLC